MKFEDLFPDDEESGSRVFSANVDPWYDGRVTKLLLEPSRDLGIWGLNGRVQICRCRFGGFAYLKDPKHSGESSIYLPHWLKRGKLVDKCNTSPASITRFVFGILLSHEP